MFMNRISHYCQDVRTSQIDLYIQYSPIQNPSSLFYWYWQTDSKDSSEEKDPEQPTWWDDK